MHDMLINEDLLRQVKFVHLFKVTVLNLYEIRMKPEIKLMKTAVGIVMQKFVSY